MKVAYMVVLFVAVLLVGVANAGTTGNGPGSKTPGGAFGDTSGYPFPVTADGGVACYDDAMNTKESLKRYDDWVATHPGDCETLWEDVPKSRRYNG